jgi:hypothetical protein
MIESFAVELSFRLLVWFAGGKLTLHIAKKRANGPKCAKTNVRLPGVSAQCILIVLLSGVRVLVSLPARLGLLRCFVYIDWARQPLL